MKTFLDPRVELKSEKEIGYLKTAGRLARQLLDAVCQKVAAGVATKDLDQYAAEWIQRHEAEPAFLNYRGFPANICVSINDEVVHGIPGPRKICEGDIVSVDVGLFYHGWCGDTAKTVAVGSISPEAKKILKVSQESLEAGIQAAVSGNRIGDISYAMQCVAENAGFHLVRSYGGHGIGRALHEDPHVPCVGRPNTGLRLVPGLVLALEVMVNQGTENVLHKEDGWTVFTEDGSLSSHDEHMVAIKENGTEILTRI